MARPQTTLSKVFDPSKALVFYIYFDFYSFYLYVHTVDSMLETQEYTLCMPWLIQQPTSLDVIGRIP